jgi:hypothetical protein
MLVAISTRLPRQADQASLAVAPQPALRSSERESVGPGEVRQRNAGLQVGAEEGEPRQRRGAG